MALLSLPQPSFSSHCFSISFSSWHQSSVVVTTAHRIRLLPVAAATTTHHQQQSTSIDKSSLIVAETASEDQLWAAACLRVRSFYDFQASSYGIQVRLSFSFFKIKEKQRFWVFLYFTGEA